jgi:hypothetical protein
VDKQGHKWIKDKRERHLSLKTGDKLIIVSRETTKRLFHVKCVLILSKWQMLYCYTCNLRLKIKG